jgi:hypothetical protein
MCVFKYNMKLIRILIVTFYIMIVTPICAVLMAGIIYGAVVETVKAVKKP